MPRRDDDGDLDAAIARIYALESELARLATENAEAQVELEELRESRYGRRTTTTTGDLSGIPSLYEHNRRLPPLGGGVPAAVVCPACLTQGDRLLMMELPGEPMIQASLGVVMICSRCGLLGVLRRAPA